MNGATQIINLAAGYLGPALSGRRVRSFADLRELLSFLFSMFYGAAGLAARAILHGAAERLDYASKYLAKALDITLALFDRRSIDPSPVSQTDSTAIAEPRSESVALATLAGVPGDAIAVWWLSVC